MTLPAWLGTEVGMVELGVCWVRGRCRMPQSCSGIVYPSLKV